MKAISLLLKIAVSLCRSISSPATNNKLKNTYVCRMGRHVKADEAYFASTSGDIQRMVRALDLSTNPVDRHFLLQTLVTETYKHRRTDPVMAELCAKVAEIHLAEFPKLAQGLKKDMPNGSLPWVLTFQHFATLLTEKQDFKRAIEVCEMALRYGLDDGTKSGYRGRIQRIKKKSAQSLAGNASRDVNPPAQ